MTTREERRVRQLAPVFISRAQWDAENGHTLYFSCSDGRFGDADHEFIHYLRLERPDKLTPPGGPATILLSASMFFTHRGDVKLLHNRHQFKRIVGVAHHDCAYYRGKYPDLDDASRKARQLADLKEFRREVGKLVPDVVVETYYAEPSEDGTIQFLAVE